MTLSLHPRRIRHGLWRLSKLDAMPGSSAEIMNMRLILSPLCALLRPVLLVAVISIASPASAPAKSNFDLKSFATKPDAWFRSAEGMRATTNVLSWQSAEGSWPKNLDTGNKPYEGDPKNVQGTFDNGATTDELRFLARAFRVTGDPRCERACLKGLDHVLKAQYPTGGWPQFYPPSKQYHRHITFNDGAMVRLLVFLRQVAQGPDFAFVDLARRKAAQESFDRGIQCILKCQIGERTLVRDTNAPPLWARFYDLENGRPIFSDRDGVKRYDYMQIGRERRNGYAWYGNWGVRVERSYARWKAEGQRRDDRLNPALTAPPPPTSQSYEVASSSSVHAGALLLQVTGAHALERTNITFKVLQFPPNLIPRIDGKADDWEIVPEDYVIGTDQLVDDTGKHSAPDRRTLERGAGPEPEGEHPADADRA
jgi:hypothetical protein